MSPLYRYSRQDGTEFDHYARIESEPLTECPTTGQPCERVIQAVYGNVKNGTPTHHSRVPKSYQSSPSMRGE